MKYLKLYEEVDDGKIDLLVLDAVIDDDGNVYNGKGNKDILKGHVERIKKKGKYIIIEILGDDGKNYPAGIDKNGRIIAVKAIDRLGNIVDMKDITRAKAYPLKLNVYKNIDALDVRDLLKERIPNNRLGINSTFTKSHNLGDSYFNCNDDYSDLLARIPTGWVNVKIDMEIVNRITKFSSNFGSNSGNCHDIFLSKLSELDRITSNLSNRPSRSIENVQKLMSGIMILRYLNENKTYFNPTAAGNIFESFMAGLIPTAKVIDNNGSDDLITNRPGESKITYQVKLFDHLAGTIDMLKKKISNYYIICLKKADRVDIYILSSDERRSNYYGNFITSKRFLSIPQIKTFGQTIEGGSSFYSLKILDLENKIDKIRSGLKIATSNMYGELSSFEYNLDGIVYGKDKDGKVIGVDDFDATSQLAFGNLEKMDTHLKDLIGVIKNRNI